MDWGWKGTLEVNTYLCVAFVLRSNFPWAAPSQWWSRTGILSDTHSWETWVSQSDSWLGWSLPEVLAETSLDAPLSRNFLSLALWHCDLKVLLTLGSSFTILFPRDIFSNKIVACLILSWYLLLGRSETKIDFNKLEIRWAFGTGSSMAGQVKRISSWLVSRAWIVLDTMWHISYWRFHHGWPGKISWGSRILWQV